MLNYNSRLLLTIVILFYSSLPLSAQHRNSVYSMFGVGQIIDDCYGVNKSLGGTGIAFHSGSTINHLNPASYTGILPASFVMESGIYGIFSNAESYTEKQSDININVNYFSASIYLTDTWAMNVGIVPFSSVEYEIRYDDTIEGDPGTIKKTFSGSGGLNKAYLGTSLKLYKGLSLGLNAGCIFGPITQTESAGSYDNYTGYELVNERSAYGFYMDYGLLYDIGIANQTLSIGMVYSAEISLNAIDNVYFVHGENAIPLENSINPDLDIPGTIGCGLALTGKRYRAGFDYQWKQWSGIQFTDQYTVTRNSNRYSIGLEIKPDMDIKHNWLGNLTFRVGGSYKNTFLELEHTPINAATVNIGFGIPWNRTNSLNLALEYGMEGTRDNGLVRNTYWAGYLSFTLHQFWDVHSR